MLETDVSISEISDGLNSLKVSLSTPKDGDVNPVKVATLYEEYDGLFKKIINLQDGPLSMMRFVLACKARLTDPLGKTAQQKGFWNCLPESMKPKVGETYQFVYDLKNSLSITEEGLQSLQTQADKIKEDLDLIKFDLKMISGKTLHEELSSFASMEWKKLSSTPVVPPLMERWGDVNSSEDEQLYNSISSLVKGPVVKTPGVKLPQDFQECFPGLFRKIEKFCDFHEWEITYSSESKLRSQGLVLFTEDPLTGEIDSSRLDDSSRIALASLYTAVASLSIQPGSLVGEENTEVALTYVCSLVAKELLGKENSELLKVALKNGDGGKALLRGRFYSLTKSGSSAIKLVIEAVEKILEKFARDLDKDKIKGDLLTQITSRAFTSLDGMQDNSYRVAIVDVYKTEEITDRRGKTVKSRVKVKKQHRVVPDLNVASNPLKAEEISKINSIKDSFNARKAVIEKRLSQEQQPTLLSRPRICRDVVNEAYEKLHSFKSIMRDRVVKIRDKATALSGGKKPDPSNWIMAKAEVLKESPIISDSVWDSLSW